MTGSNESKVTRLEKTIAEQHPEVKKWIPVHLKDGMYYRQSIDKTPMTDAEYEELRNTPGIGLIIVHHVDRPLPDENEQED